MSQKALTEIFEVTVVMSIFAAALPDKMQYRLIKLSLIMFFFCVFIASFFTYTSHIQASAALLGTGEEGEEGKMNICYFFSMVFSRF